MSSFRTTNDAAGTPGDLARDLFRVLETGDAELARRVVAPDNHNREATAGPPACAIPGPAGTLASSSWLRAAFPDLSFAVDGVAEASGEVWIRLRMRGRHDGPFVRYRDGKVDVVLPPTARTIDVEQIHVLGLRDGKVVSHKGVRDDVTMLEQLGAFPPTPAMVLRIAGWRVSGRTARTARHVADDANAAAATTPIVDSGRA
jgi:predicted ester cyclase